MQGIPSELVIVGGVGLVILAALILVKWGKQILTALVLVVGVVIVALIAWALLQQPGALPDTSGASDTIGDLADIARVIAPRDEPAAQPVYQAPASSGGFVSGLLVALVLVALGVGGYFWLRWKLAERGSLRPAALQRLHRPQGQPVIYVIEGQADDLGEYDLIPWEVDGWTDGDLFQF